MGPIVLTQLATGLGVLAGAALVKSVMDQKPMAGPFTRCPTCNGSGRMTCFCTRWSDGDVGCRSCAGSGRTACSSCGGSGTGRPLPVRITVRPPPDRDEYSKRYGYVNGDENNGNSLKFKGGFGCWGHPKYLNGGVSGDGKR